MALLANFGHWSCALRELQGMQPKPLANAKSWDKLVWLCKSCTNAKGKPYRNSGWDVLCRKCKIHKGFSFGQVVVSPVGPSKRVRDHLPWEIEACLKKDKQLEDANRRIAKLEKQLQQQAPPANGNTMGVCGGSTEGQGETFAAGRTASIKHFTKEMQRISNSAEPGYFSLAASCKVELDGLRAKEHAALPVAMRLADCAREVERLQSVKETRPKVGVKAASKHAGKLHSV